MKLQRGILTLLLAIFFIIVGYLFYIGILGGLVLYLTTVMKGGE